MRVYSLRFSAHRAFIDVNTFNLKESGPRSIRLKDLEILRLRFMMTAPYLSQIETVYEEIFDRSS